MADELKKFVQELAKRSKADKETAKELQKEKNELKKFLSEMKKLGEDIASDPGLD
jgi:polyhydroxyalkanoate synthesis regulator phasin